MNDKELDEIEKSLSTTPDFLHALQNFYEFYQEAVGNQEAVGISINSLASYFFSQGYESCLNYQKIKKMTRPFEYKSKV